MPARSYAQVRVRFACDGCTSAQEIEESPMPASRITVDEPEPRQYRFMRRLWSMSTSCCGFV